VQETVSETKLEKRAVMSGFTSELIFARAEYLAGRTGIAELTATAQACISLWEHGFALAAVTGTDALSPHVLALLGRSLALRGECVFIVTETSLIPCAHWDLRTRGGRPIAYRVSISEAAGGTTTTVLADEVLHFRIGVDVATPWHGSPPLRRAALTAGLLNSVESALSEVYEFAPLGSQIVPFPESEETQRELLARGFRGKRGGVLLRESVSVSAAGGPAPATDWRPADVSPDLSRTMSIEALRESRNAIAFAFGVLPSWFAPDTTGPLVREAQRQLALWTLNPIAALVAEECVSKLGTEIAIDTTGPLDAYDVGTKSRALATYIEALSVAKQSGVPPEDVAAALRLVDWTTTK
jgi:hypothetical protein